MTGFDINVHGVREKQAVRAYSKHLVDISRKSRLVFINFLCKRYSSDVVSVHQQNGRPPSFSKKGIIRWKWNVESYCGVLGHFLKSQGFFQIYNLVVLRNTKQWICNRQLGLILSNRNSSLLWKVRLNCKS